MTDAPTDAAPIPTDDAGRTALILDIVAKETGVARDRLQLDQKLAELEVASLDMVQAVFELENRFSVQVPVAVGPDGAEFETVGDLVNQVLGAIHQQSGV